VALQRCRPNSSLGGTQLDHSRRGAVQRDGCALLGLWQILGCLRRLPGESVLSAAFQGSKTHGLHHFWAVQCMAIYTAEATHQFSGLACWLIAPRIVALSLRCCVQLHIAHFVNTGCPYSCAVCVQMHASRQKSVSNLHNIDLHHSMQAAYKYRSAAARCIYSLHEACTQLLLALNREPVHPQNLVFPAPILCIFRVPFSLHGFRAMQAGHLHDLNPDAAGIIYEVRVYSLEAASLGQVLHAKQIRAAHCLTSVQFSPTSEHLLLAYGRSAFTLYMRAAGHSFMHACMRSFTHAFICACMLSRFLSCICSFFSFSSRFLPFIRSFVVSYFSIQVFDTCLLQKSEESSGAPSLVLRVALQTNLVNASVLITASKPVDVLYGKVFNKLFT